MKKSQLLTKAQKEDLLIEWNLYSASQQEPILAEFHKQYKDDSTQNDFLQYLRKKLEIDGYWKKAGLSWESFYCLPVKAKFFRLLP